MDGMTQSRLKGTTLLWALLILGGCAQRAPSPFQNFIGTWAMKLGRQTLIVVNFRDEGGQLKGTLYQPQSLQFDEGLRFSNIALPVKELSIAKGSVQNGLLHFSS